MIEGRYYLRSDERLRWNMGCTRCVIICKANLFAECECRHYRLTQEGRERYYETDEPHIQRFVRW